MNPSESRKSPLSPLQRADALLAVLLGALALALYIRTLAPGVFPLDSAEWQVLGYLPAHAHNPGYWVYLYLVKLFTFLPVGTVAYRVNLFSAVMGAVSVACTYLAGRQLSGGRWGGALGALALTFSAIFWSQSVFAESYTIAGAFTGAILVLVLAWYHSRRNALLFWAGLLGGLSPAVHGTIGLFAPAIALLILLARPDWRKVWKPALGGVALGLALMLAAFWAADQNKAHYNIFDTAYGPARSNFDTTLEEVQSPLGRFTFLITSRQWRSAMFVDPLNDTPIKAGDYYNVLPENFTWPVLALMLLGAVVLWARDWRLGLFFLLACTAHHLFVFNYRIGDSYTFYIPWYVYACALAAVGFGWLNKRVSRLLPRGKLYTAPVLGLLFIGLALGPGASRTIEFIRQGEPRYEFTKNPSYLETIGWYAQISSTVKRLPQNSLVFVDWYNLYAYYYAAYVEQGRTDLWFVEPTPYSNKGHMADTMIEFAVEQAPNRPVFSLWPIDEFRRAGLKTSNKVFLSTTLIQYTP